MSIPVTRNFTQISKQISPCYTSRFCLPLRPWRSSLTGNYTNFQSNLVSPSFLVYDNSSPFRSTSFTVNSTLLSEVFTHPKPTRSLPVFRNSRLRISLRVHKHLVCTGHLPTLYYDSSRDTVSDLRLNGTILLTKSNPSLFVGDLRTSSLY